MRAKLFIAALLAACAGHASATDVFAYVSGNLKPVAEMGAIRKIVNGSETTTLISEKGDSVTIENAAFTYLTFHRTSVPTGITGAKTEGTSISYGGGVVRVVSAKPLRQIRLVASDGAEAGRIASPPADAAVSTLGLAPGVYIVEAVTTDGKRITKKIVKK